MLRTTHPVSSARELKDEDTSLSAATIFIHCRKEYVVTLWCVIGLLFLEGMALHHDEGNAAAQPIMQEQVNTNLNGL
jgi:hypothetical protein